MMLLKAITLENFKGVRDPVRVDFKPVTLLFGANSAGKSTILQALHYVHEILETRNVDPSFTEHSRSIDLGGFRSLVNAHDLNKPIRIRLDTELKFPFGLATGYGSTNEESPFPDFATMEGSAWIELEVRYSHIQGRPYISEYEVGVAGELFGKIETSTDFRRTEITRLNFRHPLLNPDPRKAADSELMEVVADQIRGEEESVVEDYLRQSSIADNLPAGVFVPLALSSKASEDSALPDLEDQLPVWLLTDALDINPDPLAGFICGVLHQAFVGIGRDVRIALRYFRYVGPLREIPSRDYSPVRTQDESRWAQGLAAWDVLYRADASFIEQINEWMTREDRFGSPYRIEAARYRELDETSPLMLALKQGRALDEDETLIELFDALPVGYRLSLLDTNSDTKVLPQDVGVGVSQLLPVIVAALHSERGIVAIEQPELHIHPAWQVVLGDLFLSRSKGKDIIFLIETHSEHLMLRLLRRIRETTDGELPPGSPEATPEDIAVYFVEHRDGASRISQLRVDHSGEFTDPWPRGFFEERAEELF